MILDIFLGVSAAFALRGLCKLLFQLIDELI